MTDDGTWISPQSSGQQPSSGAPVDPHAEYLRQAAAHFGRRPAAPAHPPPAIFRPPQPTPSGGHNAVPDPQPQIHRSEPVNDSLATAPLANPHVPNQLQAQPISSAPPSPPPMSSAAPPPPWQVPATAPVARAGQDLKPEHLLWALTAFSGLATLASGLSWIIIVGACAYFAWVARTRPILWPPDVEELLVQYRLAQPTGRQMGTAGANGVQQQPLAYIPFRPLTFSELFGAAARIVTRNWTTLIGIPLFILGTFAIALSVVFMIVMELTIGMMKSAISFESLGTAMMAGAAVFGLLGLVIAFPTDALLIALGVTATGKAVQGESVRLTEVFAAARARMFAVCRLTGVYYAVFIITDIVVYGVFIAALIGLGPAALVLQIPIAIGTFFLGIMFSLAPIVLVVEGRGVIDSFSRAWALAKVDWQRLLGVHFFWAVCVAPLLFIPLGIAFVAFGFLGIMVFIAIAFAALIAYFRALQMLIYTDLRIRQERYDLELSAAWAHNTGAA